MGCPAIIRQFHEAGLRREHEVVCWGSGRPARDFLHADDPANAIMRLMRPSSREFPIDVGSGHEQSIRGAARVVQEVVGLAGVVPSDESKPEGGPGRTWELGRMRAMDWATQIGPWEGLPRAYHDVLQVVKQAPRPSPASFN